MPDSEWVDASVSVRASSSLVLGYWFIAYFVARVVLLGGAVILLRKSPFHAIDWTNFLLHHNGRYESNMNVAFTCHMPVPSLYTIQL